jgi:hypothetical protein
MATPQDAKKEQATANDHLTQAYEKVRAYIRNEGKDGLWPYFHGHEPSAEATAWNGIALRDDQEISKQVVGALIRTANQDGGWSTDCGWSNAPEHGRSDWTSAPALLALRILSQNSDESDQAIRRGLVHLFDSRTEFYGSLARLLLFAIKGGDGLGYARGWPWSPDCYHWIEPTSYALLALKLPGRPQKALYEEIITYANKFIVAQECKGGGWNHGSSYCMNVFLPPYIVTTAEALLAVQDMPNTQAVQAGLAFLQRTEPSECSAMEHAWAILALDAFGKDTRILLGSLAASQHANGSFGVNNYVTALCAIALDTAISKKNPLRYQS